MEHSSSFVQPQSLLLCFAALRIPAWQTALKKDGEEDAGAKRKRSVAKSNSTATNLSSHVPTSSSSAKSLIASKSPGILIATEKPVSRVRGNSESDAASSSRARLKEAYLGGLMDTATVKLVATKEESENLGMWTFPNLKLRVKQMWQGHRLIFKQLRRNPLHPVNQTAREVQKLKGHNGHTINACH